MRWPAAIPPQAGDRRTLRRFAWWPTRIDDTWVWLEHYTEILEYVESARTVGDELFHEIQPYAYWRFICRKLPE
jgi:hypothetical protein